ncbi:MAG: YtxH domain-containing protein [Desulfuromonadales bacterium]|nr:YtxH domain-containing protein [Desulfuromonadales bacterium]
MGNSENSNTIKSAALMIMAGGLLGAGVALLFAPQSGRRTRRDIARYSRLARKGVADKVEDFTENVYDLVEIIGDYAEEFLKKGKNVSDGVKKDLMKALEDGQEKLEKEKSRFLNLFG